ncbi:FliM/FliN family flagellar motor C-terminal domain-containing protein [Parerythrobacter jejuensis]|uniref:Flagellar motor switch protein FliN-like C-terminal domain-containing protein n=1 Tax=Parerythrobacter jejuensis TaxID=795812 RepID=A0A845AQ06_9SPHN|nr:FliM/FliN family flagellar motor C-terminal domain-containing protein [Parerythrobacter jejuensis]MXP30576.1 hypothetical protein [Parerythrobacter jejuensis]MXP33336.1 hypothetical protein [Parerythrobacter jejuensis]
MGQPVPWLPASCLTSRRAVEPFERIVEGWAAEWFPTTGWQVLGSWDAVGQPDATDWAVLRDAAKLQVKGKPKAMQALALAILGSEAQTKLTDNDLRLMRRVAGRALDDLQSRIEQSLGSSQSQPSGYAVASGAIYSLLIGVVGGAQLAVECSAADLVQIVRGTFPVQQIEDPLDPRGEGYADAAVSVAAHLGATPITLEELSALDVGDVLVLDQPADAPTRLVIDGHTTDLPFAIVEQGGTITLELQDLT